MSMEIDFTYVIDGFYDSVNYYRSETSMSPASMPAPTAAGIVGEAYTDTTALSNKTYYVRFGSVRSGVEKISNELIVSTVVSDPLWVDVELLVYGDAESYPSAILVNQSSKRGITIAGNPTIVSASVKNPYTDHGSIYFDGNADTITATGLATLTADFTQEAFVLLPASPVAGWYPDIFACSPIRVAINQSNYSAINLLIDGNIQGPAANLGREVWKHVCVMRKANVAYFFVGGVLIASYAVTGNVNGLAFGGGNTAGQQFNGYMNCLRITKGARYSETGFTAPTLKFPNK